eukprot:CAMPEP_0116151338 /NCGR_PEP_ID=MMETSP0329-20121206/20040_1 /TAXON_ID=697910 /ORGANISM="Pseudo-nitzschia arenysensis, Strain B593" /LENGTH=139 /DNA_ID=CAMNT_0003647937 /DNA_START=199 /DNA_END=618 /DNA_ORIENTATION=-
MTAGHRLLCLSKESAKKLRNASWNLLRHLEALVRLREDNRATADSINGAEKDSKIFTVGTAHAAAVARPKVLRLLSPNSYNHSSIFSDKNNSVDWWAPIKRAHDELFEKAVDRGEYCELDLDRLFADEDFLIQVFYTRS